MSTDTILTVEVVKRIMLELRSEHVRRVAYIAGLGPMPVTKLKLRPLDTGKPARSSKIRLIASIHKRDTLHG